MKVLTNYDPTINEIRNHFAITASEIGVWDWDLLTNEVYYSVESLKILELNQVDSYFLTADTWDNKVHPDDKALYFENMKLHFENKTPFYETYHRINCNGNYKWILDRGKVIDRTIDGKPLRVIGTHIDVSAQKEKEENLLETLNLVNNQNKKLLNFAHIVSHNLKNHSGNLRTILNMQKEGFFEFQEFTQYIDSVTKELSDSIQNLEELVTIQNNKEIEKKVLNVSVFLNKILNILVDISRENKIEIINNVPSHFEVYFNSAYLESVLLNLTSNAIKYSNDGVKSFVKFSTEETSDYKILIIEDNGIGIDLDKYNDQIFGLYKTFHNNQDAKGVGLHITKNQMEAMNGKIEVYSKINEGSTFRLYFKK